MDRRIGAHESSPVRRLGSIAGVRRRSATELAATAVNLMMVVSDNTRHQYGARLPDDRCGQCTDERAGF